MGTKRLDTISDFARHGYKLNVECRSCGHVGKLNARALTARCVAPGWQRDMASVTRRLRCSICGGRELKCGVFAGPALEG